MRRLMRRAIGWTLAVLAALLGATGIWFIVAAGGREPEPVMVTGGFMVAVAAVLAAAAALVLRPR
jgi:hypothetical protein